MCLDSETLELHNRQILENVKLNIILLPAEDATKVKRLMKSTVFCLRKEFKLWNLTLQLWFCGDATLQETIQPPFLYAVLTSGSTGEPKIVKVPESSILPNITHLRSEWRVTAEDVVLLSSPPTFDLFLLELLLALVSGAGMFIAPPDIAASPTHFLDLVFPPHSPPPVTIAQFTPSVFTRWTCEEILTRVLTRTTSLKVLALGGEKFPSVGFWKCCRAQDNQTRLYSLYGTTELSCWAMMATGPDVEDQLGTPLSETLLQVQDETGAAVQQGTGHLFIGSESRICFVGDEDSVVCKTPVFRATGDMVTVKDGVYRYVGRKDNIVKRWGHRVCLDQLERLAGDCTDVASACCVLHADKLVLFISLKQESKLSLDQVTTRIRRLILAHLNKASQPDLILQQDTFPLTRHGKINRKKLVNALRETDVNDTSEGNPVDILKSSWQDFTQDRGQADNGFLNLGGNSVTAMQIVNKLSPVIKDLGSKLLSALLSNKSLLECCQLLEHKSFVLEEEKLLTKRIIENVDNPKQNKLIIKQSRPMLCIQMKGHNANLKYVEGEFHLNICWLLNLSKCVDASPTCVAYSDGDSHTFVGSHSGKLACIDVSKGSLIWELQLPDRIESSLCPSSTGFALIGCYDGNVYSVDVACGSIMWRLRTEAMVKGIPFLIDDTWIFGSYDYHVYCVKVWNGHLVWKQKLGGPVLATPVGLPDSHVVVTSLRGEVAALRASDGSEMWRTQLGSPVYSSPHNIGGLLIVAQVAGVLHALQPDTGNQIWQYRAGGEIFSSLTSVEDRVMFGCHDHHVYCLKVCNGELVWRVDLGSVVYATPFPLSPTHLIAASQSGLVCIIDVRDSTTSCSLNLPGQVFSSPVAFENYIIVGSRDDNVYCIKINTNCGKM